MGILADKIMSELDKITDEQVIKELNDIRGKNGEKVDGLTIREYLTLSGAVIIETVDVGRSKSEDNNL